MEAARVWSLYRDLHLVVRQAYTCWLTRDDHQQVSKGLFALHSQTVQMICHQFLANMDTARELHQTNPKIRYLYKDKRICTLLWSAQAVSRERGRLVSREDVFPDVRYLFQMLHPPGREVPLSG